MSFALKRIYEKPHPDDGIRVLVDRLWPRGLSKQKARVDLWLKEIAPSKKLRQSFHNGKIDSEEFRNAYFTELSANDNNLEKLIEEAKDNQVTLLYSSKNSEYNNAVVLKQYLKMTEH